MEKTTIEQRFGSAMRFVRTLHERGFQARVSEQVGMQSSNLSEIITKDKGTFETTRRAVFEECAKLTPQLEGMTYETFLHLGELILSGVPGAEALERARGAVASGHCVLPVMQVSGKAHVGNVVNNGVMSVGDAPVSDSGPRDEIRAEIEGWLAECFGDMSMSQKIAAREAIRQGVPDFAAYVERREQKKQE